MHRRNWITRWGRWRCGRSRPPRGFTLVEILVAVVITLMMMAAVVNVFDMIGTGVADSRATLEMTDRLRLARNRLQDDLTSLTCPTIPWRRPEEGVGYFELIEGSNTDKAPGAAPAGSIVHPSARGDFDDVLAFTIRSRGEPFVASNGATTIQSDTAEVVWWAVGQPNGTATLHRRMFLVAPWAAAGGNVRAVSLGDLTKRENRAGHAPTFPHELTPVPLTGAQLGEDVMLSNVLAFDVRVFDPEMAIKYNFAGGTFLPTDPGYTTPGTFGNPGTGSFANLGSVGSTTLTRAADPRSGLTRTYCTWSFHYEHDGADQDGDGSTDEGTNGFDDDGANGVDDMGERETMPPYSAPLRGVQVILRVYEPDSRQIRQVSIVQNFALD